MGVDIANWLLSLGLQQYEKAFRDNDIDSEILPKLTAEDLTCIGISSVGHRRKLIEAIAGLGTPRPTAPDPESRLTLDRPAHRTLTPSGVT